MNNLLIIFWNVLILYVLLETDAIYKWAKLFKLKFFKYKEFEEKKEIYQKYQYFIRSKYPNFFNSLIFCQECLGIWIVLCESVLFKSQMGGWIMFGENCIFTLCGISVFKYLLKKMYE
jgi:hypothetical protein